MDNTIRIPKDFVRYAVLFALAFVIVGYHQGIFTKIPSSFLVPSGDALVMTSEQAKLTRQAINLVQEELERDGYRTAELVKQALYAHLPTTVREDVMKALGNPELSYMRDALEVLEGKIVVK